MEKLRLNNQLSTEEMLDFLKKNRYSHDWKDELDYAIKYEGEGESNNIGRLYIPLEKEAGILSLTIEYYNHQKRGDYCIVSIYSHKVIKTEEANWLKDYFLFEAEVAKNDLDMLLKWI